MREELGGETVDSFLQIFLCRAVARHDDYGVS